MGRIVVGGLVLMAVCETLAERFVTRYASERARAPWPICAATLLYGACAVVFGEVLRRSSAKHAALNAAWQVSSIICVSALSVLLGEPLAPLEVLGVVLAVLACACFARSDA